MQQSDYDPGLTQQFSGELRRVINPDGSFNVRKVGSGWRYFNPYLYLINTTWPLFFVTVLLAFLIINMFFAWFYLIAGADLATSGDPGLNRYQTAFFFSVHTLTTVGYGDIYPKGFWPNFISAVEAMTGLLGFAIATGLVYGRFSRPSARLVFSDRMLVAPYREGSSLQFRIANGRKNVLMELEAKLLFMTVEKNREGKLKRDYADLKLERRFIQFLPLSWTIVHPIEEGSPLMGLTAEDLARLEAEFIIVIRSFDDTFSQTVHARYSYRHDEIIWGAKFVHPFHIDKNGDMVLNTALLSKWEGGKEARQDQS